MIELSFPSREDKIRNCDPMHPRHVRLERVTGDLIHSLTKVVVEFVILLLLPSSVILYNEQS